MNTKRTQLEIHQKRVRNRLEIKLTQQLENKGPLWMQLGRHLFVQLWSQLLDHIWEQLENEHTTITT